MSLDQIVSLSKQVSTVLFFLVFVYVLFSTYRSSNRKQLEELKYSIFDEDELRRIR